MQIPFLAGEYDLTIDPKNRLIVPSEIRKMIDSELYSEAFGTGFLVNMRDKVPWFYPERYYAQLMNSQVPPGVTPSKDLIKYLQIKVAMSYPLKWDSQGRMVLPDRLLREAGLQIKDDQPREVTLVGMQDHLELYSRPVWLEMRAKLEAEGEAIEARAAEAILEAARNRRELEGYGPNDRTDNRGDGRK